MQTEACGRLSEEEFQQQSSPSTDIWRGDRQSDVVERAGCTPSWYGLTAVTSHLNAGWQLSSWCNSRHSGDSPSKTRDKTSPADSVLLKSTCSNGHGSSGCESCGRGSEGRSVSDHFESGSTFQSLLFICKGNGFSFGVLGFVPVFSLPSVAKQSIC